VKNIAIHIGSTNVRVFYISDSGSPIQIRDEKNRGFFPSVVWSSGPGAERLVGYKAAARIGTRPLAAADIKRSMTHGQPITVGGLPVTPAEVLAELLMHARRLVETSTNDSVNRVVISTPAYFTAADKNVVYVAAVSVFFEGEESVARDRLFFDLDPIAAERAYGSEHRDGRFFLVYDFGSTFDVALLRVLHGSEPQIFSIGGDFEGGGESVDTRVASLILDRLIESGYNLTPGILEREDSSRWQILKKLGEDAKIQLSTETQCSVVKQCAFTDNSGEPVDIDISFTREDFEALIGDIIDATIQTTLDLLNNSAIVKKDIARVLLVGGGSRIPIVARTLRAVFSCPISLDIDPDFVIARGAALNSVLREATGEAVANPVPRRSETFDSSRRHATVRALRVFLCHASADKSRVRDLYQRLQNDGFEPWLDVENLLPGQEWEPEIIKAVKSSDVVLVCFSPSSITKHGFVQKEIKTALDVADEKLPGTIFIIPTMLEQCAVPERLQRWQWVSLIERNGYDRLIKTLRMRKEAM